VDYHVWGAMLEAYCKLRTKLKTNAKLKEALQGPIDKAVKDFSNKATGGWCLLVAGGEHFEHSQSQ